MKKIVATLFAVALLIGSPGVAQAEEPPRPEPTTAPTSPVSEPRASASPAPAATASPSVPKPTGSSQPTDPSTSAANPTDPSATLPPAPAPLADGESPATTESGHKPGYADVKERVPAGTKMANGSPHPCVGRNLLYRSHIDAVYATRNQGKPAIMSVAGAGVVDSNSTCLRLGPDAHNDGREVSRIFVPNDPDLGFLGKPGTILWNAPQTFNGSWQPIWAGMGAFDPSHEIKVPDRKEIPSGGVSMILSGFSGPGQMEVFVYNAGGTSIRLFSTRHKILEHKMQVGSHSHLNWTFTKPGIYQTTWAYSYVDGAGKTVRSPDQLMYWLVGSDSDVSLPDGLTKPAYSIKKTTEELRKQAGLPEVDGHDDSPTIPTGPAAPPFLSEADAKKELTEAFGSSWPTTIYAKGQIEAWQPMKAGAELPERPAVALDGKLLKTPNYELAVEIPDSSLTKVPDYGWTWGTRKDGISLLFSGKEFDFKNTDGSPMVADLSFSSSPVNSKTFMGRWIREQGKVKFSSVSEIGSGIGGELYQAPTNNPISLIFTRPGTYVTYIRFAWKQPDGSNWYADTPIGFLVGNTSINLARKAKDPKAELLPTLAENAVPKPENPIPAPDYRPWKVGDQPVAEPDPDAPKPPADQVPRLGLKQAKQGLSERWSAAKTIFMEGHLDLAVKPEGTAFHDTADPSKPKWIDSGKLAIAVPDSTYRKTPMGQAFVLPQSQEQHLPWVGFNTERLDANKISGPVSVAIAKFSGPGRLRQGHLDLLSGFQATMDSKNSELKSVYEQPTHDHQYFLFDQPGLYQVDYRYSWLDKFNVKHEKLLAVDFLVGDAYLQAGLERAGMPVPPGLGAKTPADDPKAGFGLGEVITPPPPKDQPKPDQPEPKTKKPKEDRGPAATSLSFGRSLLADDLAANPNSRGSGQTTETALIDAAAVPAATKPGRPAVPQAVGEPLASAASWWTGFGFGIGGAALIAGIALLLARRRP